MLIGTVIISTADSEQTYRLSFHEDDPPAPLWGLASFLSFVVRSAGRGVAGVWGATRAWLAALGPLGVTGGAMLINGQIGVLLSGLDGPETAGLYRIAIQTSLIAALGYTAVVAALGPRFAAAHARGNSEDLARTAAAGAALATASCLPFVAVFGLAGRPVMGLVFGEAFASGGKALAVMTLAQLCNALFGASSAALIMTGHERRAAAAFLVALAVHAVLGVVLIPRFGVEGAAFAYLGQMVVMNLVLWVQARRLLGVDTGVWAAWRLLRRRSGP